MKFDFVLGEVEERLEKIDEKLTETNELLAKIEENLRVPNMIEWAKFRNRGFEPNYFVDISDQFKKKITAMKFYKKELRKYPHSRSLKAIESLARFRGVSSGVDFAEGFYLNRWIE